MISNVTLDLVDASPTCVGPTSLLIKTSQLLAFMSTTFMNNDKCGIIGSKIRVSVIFYYQTAWCSQNVSYNEYVQYPKR